MSPGSSTESYPAFARIELKKPQPVHMIFPCRYSASSYDERVMERRKFSPTILSDARVNDTFTISEGITQTGGILQGDPLSPLLFNVATADVTRVCPPTTSLFIYADDMALGSTKKEDVQETFNRIVNWADENQLHINKDKTVQMTFRRGGRKTDNDTFYYKNEPLKVTNAFKYLGVILQTTTKSFRIHVKERATSAIKAIFDIKNIRQLSLDTAIRLFEAKIVPIITYGIDIIWTNLSLRDLRTMENVKARFLKAALGISKHAPSRIAYELARENFLIEDLRYKLPSTENSTRLLEERRQKRDEIWLDFYSTNAMTDRTWAGPNKELRHTSNPRLPPQTLQDPTLPLSYSGMRVRTL
ncbi:hypothetical protein ANN_25452 [Periplaneta americana]|uniref:Reverse transcriptase domain-containing protein n=1 Tax=Periplaneta americana TaxID=6978 RepID=A0ABQ8S1E2_PERAM|nr:hypothetical protein ANN_25452 [Periplaneta americana]